MTILWDEDLRLVCEQAERQPHSTTVLYRIRDWQKLSTSPSLRKRLLALIAPPQQAEAPETQELTI